MTDVKSIAFQEFERGIQYYQRPMGLSYKTFNIKPWNRNFSTSDFFLKFGKKIIGINKELLDLAWI